ncbi:MAG: Asp-tRNA(Asn)/Glu-tRNA(Gln) amidotransferase subunit GatA [Parcubacteria group bacterium]
MSLNGLSIKEAHDGLLKKRFTSVELTRACFDAIKKQDAKLNAFITLTEDSAYQAAERVDAKIKAKKKIGMLEGIPVAIKDNILVDGVKTTAASKILFDYVATYDATVIEKLKEAGAIIIGKTNLDEFAMGSTGESSFFGPTRNPVDLKKVPGGTSSGSAASVVANETIFSLGSDTGGSVRQPAAYCGVVGLKPTYGRVSRHGLIAMSSGFDQVGSVTKTVGDAAHVLATISGVDKYDSTTAKKPLFDEKSLKKGVKGLKIGVPKEFFIKGMDKGVGKNVKVAIDKLIKAGAKIVDVSLPMTEYALAVYYILMPAEVSSNLARYDGMRYGFQAKSANLLDTYLKTRTQGFGEEARRRLIVGTFVLSSGYYEDYYKKAQQARRLIKRDFERVFKTVDCLITPTTPTVAYNLGEKITDPLAMYLGDIFTVSANVAGLPAISVPFGKVGKLPVGVQIMAPWFDEETMLRVGLALEK